MKVSISHRQHTSASIEASLRRLQLLRARYLDDKQLIRHFTTMQVAGAKQARVLHRFIAVVDALDDARDEIAIESLTEHSVFLEWLLNAYAQFSYDNHW